MTLTTGVTEGGEECVERDPSRIDESREDTDIIRLVNANAPNSGQTITVTINPADAKKLFEPVPAAKTKLDPGESVDWTVKPSIPGHVGIKFQTRPGPCSGHDQDDVIIRC
jgi:hypothetical protein